MREWRGGGVHGKDGLAEAAGMALLTKALRGDWAGRGQGVGTGVALLRLGWPTLGVGTGLPEIDWGPEACRPRLIMRTWL